MSYTLPSLTHQTPIVPLCCSLSTLPQAQLPVSCLQGPDMNTASDKRYFRVFSRILPQLKGCDDILLSKYLASSIDHTCCYGRYFISTHLSVLDHLLISLAWNDVSCAFSSALISLLT